MLPLDRSFNIAVLNISSRLFPTGFDVSDHAPSTYAELKELLDSGARMVVYSGGSEKTIYADPEVNYSFRAWHDWCHWRGRHPFDAEGEISVCNMQCDHIRTLYGVSEHAARWCRIIHAEIIGQQMFYDRYGQFPEDQMAFVKRFLADPTFLFREAA